MCFGDLFQLEPVQGRYVFKEPSNQEHAMSFKLRNLWNLFSVINLEENHRQGDEKVFGDMLNRVRIGAQTDEDIAMLQTRVRPRNDPSLDLSLIHI